MLCSYRSHSSFGPMASNWDMNNPDYDRLCGTWDYETFPMQLSVVELGHNPALWCLKFYKKVEKDYHY